MKLEKVSIFGLLMLAFTSLLMATSVFFPYINGKAMFVKVIITIVSLIFFYLLCAHSTFRANISNKLQVLKKNKVFSSTTIYMGIFLISTLLAVNKLLSFWGEPERGEGFVGVFFFFFFFVFSVLLFNRKNWIWFFRLNLFAGLIMFIKAVVELVNNPGIRATAFIGNADFLALYFVFIVFSSFLIFFDSKKENNNNFSGWMLFSSISFLASIVGLFLTQTRGALLGALTGVFITFIYFAIKGKDKFIYKNITFKKASIVFIIASIAFVILFIGTRHNPFWQKIPIFGRLAQISLNDNSTGSRLYATKIGLTSINPLTNGAQKFLFGWGWENYNIAWNKNYDPKSYMFERTSLDRAHNKLVDVLVMNGLLGLLAYLSLWIFSIRAVWKMSFSAETISILFFSIAFFVQNLFVFDQISTYIPFFCLLAFIVFKTQESNEK